MPGKLTLNQKLAALHEIVANNYASWHAKYRYLEVNADVLKRHRSELGLERRAGRSDGPSELEIELMLRAFAIEALLKAVWVRQGHVVIETGEFKMKGDMVTHDLVRIAEAAGIKLVEQEKRLLRRLTRSVFLGRYPIRRRSSNVEEWRDGWSGEYDQMYKEFVDAVHEVLRKPK